MYLIFDTETTGLPKDYNAPASDSDNWPRMIQIAWQIYAKNGDCLDSREYIIKPEGFEIPKQASDVHGITTERALEEGRDLKEILNYFNDALKNCGYVIAHNYSFDENIIEAEMIRKKIVSTFNDPLYNIKSICTKELSTNYCKIDGPYGYKWPTLAELHNKLFGEDFDGAHDALVDVKACARCFFELKKLGIINL